MSIPSQSWLSGYIRPSSDLWIADSLDYTVCVPDLPIKLNTNIASVYVITMRIAHSERMRVSLRCLRPPLYMSHMTKMIDSAVLIAWCIVLLCGFISQKLSRWRHHYDITSWLPLIMKYQADERHIEKAKWNMKWPGFCPLLILLPSGYNK